MLKCSDDRMTTQDEPSMKTITKKQSRGNNGLEAENELWANYVSKGDITPL